MGTAELTTRSCHGLCRRFELQLVTKYVPATQLVVTQCPELRDTSTYSRSKKSAILSLLGDMTSDMTCLIPLIFFGPQYTTLCPSQALLTGHRWTYISPVHRYHVSFAACQQAAGESYEYSEYTTRTIYLLHVEHSSCVFQMCS